MFWKGNNALISHLILLNVAPRHSLDSLDEEQNVAGALRIIYLIILTSDISYFRDTHKAQIITWTLLMREKAFMIAMCNNMNVYSV